MAKRKKKKFWKMIFEKIKTQKNWEWWIFILLPLFFVGIVNFLLFLKDIYFLLILTQQLFFYALILSSTEIGVRFHFNRRFNQNLFNKIGVIVLIALIGVLFLIITYISD